jgi:hypothetical protein
MPLQHHISTLMMKTEYVPEATFTCSTLPRLFTQENFSAHDYYEMLVMKQSRSVFSRDSRFVEVIDDNVGRSI